MKDLFLPGALALAGVFGLYFAAGFPVAYLILYGALTIMSAVICATFLWLWIAERHRLSLGMSLSWAGTSVLNGSWYQANLLPGLLSPEMPVLIGLACYFLGAFIHIETFQRALQLPRWTIASGLLAGFLGSIILYLVCKA